MLTPLTTIRCWSGMVRRTSPCLPLSLPAMTITGSPGARSSQRRFSSGLFLSIFRLQDLRGERDDLHEVALAQLAGDRSEDTGAARVVGGGEGDGGGRVAAVGLRGADLDDDGLVHLVADHGAEADLAPAACLRLRRGRGRRCGGVAHSASSFLARPRRFGFGSSSDSASG